MSTWSIFNADGQKVAQFTGREVDAALNVPTGGHMEVGNIDGNTKYFDGLTVLPRPNLDIPTQHSITTNTDWTLTGILEGTVVIIDGVEADVADGTNLTLTFQETGVWQIELRPPFPWMVSKCMVIVT